MPRNFDYPMPMHGRMMRQRLWEAQLDAGMLYDVLRDNDRVPAWTLDKVATGAHDLHQVSRYLRFKASNPIQWGAVDPTKSRTTLLDKVKVGAVFLAAMVAATGVMVFAAKSLEAAAVKPTKPTRKRARRPRYAKYATL
jgi:hypothetical protein